MVTRKNREFLMLAQVADLDKHSIGGWMVSEKLDGQRCFWDGGITRGMRCVDIPFANVEKHGRFLEEKFSSGLWSRYGQPIAAPASFLDSLPKIFLDGELYAGRGNFQHVMSTVKDHIPGPGWKQIKFAIFDCPSGLSLCQDGKINNTNFRKDISGLYNWFLSQYKQGNAPAPGTFGFESQFSFTYDWLKTQMSDAAGYHSSMEYYYLHKQYMLPFPQTEAVESLMQMLSDVTDNGGEGLMIRKRESKWEPFRVYSLLKLKRFQDSEATIIGYIAGEETTKGSKLRGMVGAMLVDWKGKRFKLSGFTDEEREVVSATHSGGTPYINDELAKKIAYDNPGQQLPLTCQAKHFPLGTQVTFRYRELSDDGIPKEARFHRIRRD